MVTVSDAGKAGIAESDEAVLAYAYDNSRILLTLNRKHFIRLHNEGKKHSGIIVCSYDPDFIAQAERIHTAISSEESIQGELLRINRP